MVEMISLGNSLDCSVCVCVRVMRENEVDGVWNLSVYLQDFQCVAGIVCSKGQAGI